MRPKNKYKVDESRIGGIGFCISLVCLLVLAGVNAVNLPLLWDEYAAGNLLYFCGGGFVGAIMASISLRGRSYVFLHEFKHWIAAGLAGASYKKLVVGPGSGHFEFSYRDPQYNAFIALAPYYLPLFTFLALLIGTALWRDDHAAFVVAAGVGFGIDGGLNFRDVSPHQTDFSRLIGGYWAGMVYVLAFNLAVLTTLLGYVFQGIYGIKTLVYGLGITLLRVL
jgi:hypothetical protein